MALENLHFLLVPLMSQSHLIPFMDVAKLIALRGATVSITITPVNASKNQSFIDQAKKSNLNVNFIILDFPSKEVGLPKGHESLENMSNLDFISKLFAAHVMLKPQVDNFLEHSSIPVSCIISDLSCAWTSELALKFKIPRFVFMTVSCFCLYVSHQIGKYKLSQREGSEYDKFLIPEMPDEIEFTKAELPKSMARPGGPAKGNDDCTDEGFLVNSFFELESKYVDANERIGKKMYCIGPLSLCNQAAGNNIGRGDKAAADGGSCLKWLDSQMTGSVVYVCFGSLCKMSTVQLKELGEGLEASGNAFIWILKKADCSSELEEWFSAEKFDEKVAGRGLIIRGWAPQVLILSHPAIGGFMTHCGWNSTMEGVAAGVPMITWPMFAEQFHNEKMIVYVLKTGVRVGVKKAVNQFEAGVKIKFGNSGIQIGDAGDEEEVLVQKDAVKKAISKLMDAGEEAQQRRRRAKELGELASKAVAEGGSSYQNLTAVIEHVQKLHG